MRMTGILLGMFFGVLAVQVSNAQTIPQSNAQTPSPQPTAKPEAQAASPPALEITGATCDPAALTRSGIQTPAKEPCRLRKMLILTLKPVTAEQWSQTNNPKDLTLV